MKLVNFKHLQGYWFILNFENGEEKRVNLSGLIEKYVCIENTNTAQINPEWGCLEFNHAMVDIDPKTLYRYASQNETEVV